MSGVLPVVRYSGIARSIIALGQLSMLAITPVEAYFAPLTGYKPFPDCGRLSASVGAFCVGDRFGIPHQVTAWVVCAILCTIVAGYFPRILGIIHFWISLSVNASISLPDGGESAAQAATLILMFISLADTRFNHWQFRVNPAISWLNPIAWGFSKVLRIQVAWIYVQAAIAKVTVSAWAQGTALYYIFRDPMFGVKGTLFEPLLVASEIPFVTLLLSWMPILLEVSIAILLFTAPRVRIAGLVVCIILHGAFIAVLGLWSFGLIMIGIVASVTITDQGVSTVRAALNRFPVPRTRAVGDGQARS
ncbi:hypothetical protein I8D64_11740 [Brachybacterium sp. MASK1Z-5]|uniref:HTTM-like domain-containing protein n=1 Tax=Brachybacterium halotolerans TaxID=2795215 RepID=A0ABS1BBL6_9MICO|nr:hypothetical protein [Brachybacterium halotolerans]MBK0332071.1 hypothetical protein [Brachybacterium halotolerans]